MPDIVASQVPAGAGRFLSIIWPDPLQLQGAAFTANMKGRVQSIQAVGGQVLNVGAGTSTPAAVWNGVPCAQVVSAAAAGRQMMFYPGFPVYLRTSRSLISPAVDDSFVYRFVINAAMQGNAPTAAGRDFGFELVSYNGAAARRIAADNIPGIGIRWQDANTIQFLCNGANGLQVVNLTAAPFDATQFHTLDLRITSPTAAADAFLTLRLDDALQSLGALNSTWGAGTNLPNAQAVGAFVGMAPTVIADAGVATSFFCYSCECIAAPSELMTL